MTRHRRYEREKESVTIDYRVKRSLGIISTRDELKELVVDVDKVLTNASKSEIRMLLAYKRRGHAAFRILNSAEAEFPRPHRS